MRLGKRPGFIPVPRAARAAAAVPRTPGVGRRILVRAEAEVRVVGVEGGVGGGFVAWDGLADVSEGGWGQNEEGFEAEWASVALRGWCSEMRGGSVQENEWSDVWEGVKYRSLRRPLSRCRMSRVDWNTGGSRRGRNGFLSAGLEDLRGRCRAR